MCVIDLTVDVQKVRKINRSYAFSNIETLKIEGTRNKEYI